jgi:molybdopterin-containing oxidoreductase family iron-sulfur binding subunit
MSPLIREFSAADLSRREFMQLLGASAALAGATGCVREPTDKILPYLTTPPDVLPGVSRPYATAMTLDGYATGLLVDSVDGRPVKIEGNPDHPASLGAAGVYEQASLLELYDPNRAQHCRHARRASHWTTLAAAFAPAALHQRAGARGAGLQLLLEPASSPQIAALLDRFRTEYPAAGVHFYASCANPAGPSAAQDGLGTPLVAQHDFTAARVIVSLDADFLAQGPFHLRYARDYSSQPRAQRAQLFVAESEPSPTGTLAERVAVGPARLGHIGAALLRHVADGVAHGSAARMPVAATLPADLAAWVKRAGDALLAHRGRAIVIAGARQSRDVQLVAMALNDLLDNVGHTVWYTASPIIEAGAQSHDLAAFTAALAGGAVDTLVIGAVNPGYAAPADAQLTARIRAVPHSLYHGAYVDETARATHWFAPTAHYLESWGDSRAYDGTVSPVQPLIAPLYDGRTTAELLALLLGDTRTTRSLLQVVQPASASDTALRRGLVDGSALPRQTPHFRWDTLATLSAASPATDQAVDVVIAPGRGVYDGRFAANAWLQELPDPLSKVTWDNAALVGTTLARRLSLVDGDVVRIAHHARAVELPVVVMPGHADDTISLALGYGRQGDGILADTIGVDVNSLRLTTTPFRLGGAQVTATGRHRTLASTQRHWSIEGRASEILDTASVAAPAPRPLYHAPAHGLEGFAADQWAMTVDLALCTGCSACVVACQAENNIPVVGRAGVMQSREMQWIRIDRYVDASPGQPVVTNQPMLCQHCENAPCEYVCPVAATVHSSDGLNEMIYNRCVGTRFCSNNCPYKVRRFNWLNYHEHESPVDELLYNPDVTVRARGVMEKCSFCVQRLRAAQHDAELAGAPRTGPVMTACQQACPTRAIIFGSLTNPDDAVTTSFHDARSFAALESLDTQPRVRYLARTPDRTS